MKIETKFNIGQDVFYVENNKVKNSTINSIELNINRGTVFEKYYIDEHTAKSILSEYLFSTKHDLLNSL